MSDKNSEVAVIDPAQSQKVQLTKGIFGKAIAYKPPPLRKWKCPLFPSGHISAYIVGASGCGKTHCLLNIVPNFEDLKFIAYFSLVQNNEVCQILRGYCDHEEIPFYTATEPETGQKMIQEAIASKMKTEYALIIFDDFCRVVDKRDNSPYGSFISTCSQMLRNEHCHQIIITQSAWTLVDAVKNNVNLRIVFRLETTHAQDAVRNDFIANSFGDKYWFRKVYDIMTTGGRFSYFALVNDPDCKKIFVHLQSKSDDHFAPIPTETEFKTKMLEKARASKHRVIVEEVDDDDDDDEKKETQEVVPRSRRSLSQFLR